MSKRKKKARKPKRRRLPIKQRRSCGECTLCCTAMGVPELSKPHYERCSKLGPRCTIYSARPKSCRAFECLWLQGLGEPEHRPDHSGLVLAVTVKNGILGPAGTVIVAHEVEPGASDLRINDALLQTVVSHTRAVIIARRDGSRTVLSNDPAIRLRTQPAVTGV